MNSMACLEGLGWGLKRELKDKCTVPKVCTEELNGKVYLAAWKAVEGPRMNEAASLI